MAFEFLEDFGKNRPRFGVNMARMRNDAHPQKLTLFVEGSDDKDFFRSHLKDRSRWKIEYGPGKKGVMARYRKYLENPTVSFAVFSVDLDFDFAVELLLKKDEHFRSRIVDDPQLFYQLFDAGAGKGFNDLETFLFMSDSYSSMMVEYYDDDEAIDEIRAGILKMGVTMGALRVANILVREVCGLPEDASMLCRRGLKFDAGFMESFGLVNFEDMSVASLDMVGDILTLEFGGEEYGAHLPLVIKNAHDILNFLHRRQEHFSCFLRGHDLMDLLARRMAFDCGRKGSSLKAKKKAQVAATQDLEKLRDELESDLRKAAGNSMEEIRKFPLGALLK